MYFGQRALHALRAIADVHLNPTPHDLPEAELVAAARDCDVLIGYRQTPAPASLFAVLPKLAAFVRCAMDIRTVDVVAASANGVLVTRASPGFNAAVAEWIIAMMINLGRGIAHQAAAYRRGQVPVPQMGVKCAATVGNIGWRYRRCLGELVLGFARDCSSTRRSRWPRTIAWRKCR